MMNEHSKHGWWVAGIFLLVATMGMTWGAGCGGGDDDDASDDDVVDDDPLTGGNVRDKVLAIAEQIG